MSQNHPQSVPAAIEEAVLELAPEAAPNDDADHSRAILARRLESITDFERHSRKCQICNHPDIDDIEDEFINWTTTDRITKAFKLKGESTLYRHARATGLNIRRRENLSAAVEKVLEQVDHTDMPTVSEILRAARILARLNSRGQWVFPPAAARCSQVVQAVSSGYVLPESNVASDSRRLARKGSSLQPQASSFQNSNRQTYEKLELGVSDTKQTSEVISGNNILD